MSGEQARFIHLSATRSPSAVCDVTNLSSNKRRDSSLFSMKHFGGPLHELEFTVAIIAGSRAVTGVCGLAAAARTQHPRPVTNLCMLTFSIVPPIKPVCLLVRSGETRL